MDITAKQIQEILTVCDLDLLGEKKDSQLVVAYPLLGKMPQSSNIDWTSSDQRPNTLYIHIPFCTGICTYCNYVTKASDSNSPEIDRYIDLLEKESMILRANLGHGKIPVTTIYIGGGTPTILNLNNLRRLFRIIEDNFDLDNCLEYTLEGCPETMTLDRLKLAKDHGVNRISIGVESFDNNVLARVNRRHDSSKSKECIANIRSAGFDDFDIDLINNLPGSTIASTLSDCVAVNELDIPNVTLYHYHIKPKSIDRKRVKIEDFVGMKLEQIQKHSIYRTHLGAKYDEYMCDWYSIGGHRFKHQLLKWTQSCNQLTLGQGCYGNFHDMQFKTHDNLDRYQSMISNGQSPIYRAQKITDFDLEIKNYIFSLRLLKPFDCKNHASIQTLMTTLENLGLMMLTVEGWIITDPGRYFLDEIQRALANQGSTALDPLI